MTRSILLILAVTSNFCVAQNLVPNPSFEAFTICPNQYSQLHHAEPWITPSAGSPDYYNACASDTSGLGLGVPDNSPGFQPAHDGSAYVGFYLWTGPPNTNIREYIEAPLTEGLIADQCYDFEMYVNLTEESNYTTYNIGVYFSDTMVSGIGHYNPLSFNAHIENSTTNVFDTLSWTLVSGEYVAEGGERYIIIGNFDEDFETDTTFLPNQGIGHNILYCFVDDISLVENNCLSSIRDKTPEIARLFPNPAFNVLTVECVDFIQSIAVFDMHGGLVIQTGGRKQNRIDISIENLEKGIYNVVIVDNEGQRFVERILKK